MGIRGAGLSHLAILVLVGILCATGALVSWTWFAVANTGYLRRNPHFDGNEWSVLLGLATGLFGSDQSVLGLLLQGQHERLMGHTIASHQGLDLA